MQAEQLENLVQKRRIKRFLAEVKPYLKLHTDPESRIQISDWYRRLGKYSDALKVLTQFENVPSGTSTGTPEGKIRLQTAHVLNQAGASFSALQIIQTLKLSSADDFRIAGQIALDNYDAGLALNFLNQFHKLNPNPHTYRSRLTEFARADAFNASGDSRAALSLLKQIQIRPDETLLQAIALEIRGEYLAELGQFAESLVCLRKSLGLMPEEDTTVDSGMLYKWLGYVSIRLGYESEGLAFFKKAEKILASPFLRIEAHFHLLVLKLLAQKKGDEKVKEKAVARLFHYPGLSFGFRQMLERMLKIRAQDYETCAFGKPKARVKIRLSANEFFINGRASLGIPSELKMAAFLKIAEGWGLSITRAKSTLWPEEIFGFFSLDARIHSFLNRLKKQHELHTEITNGVMKFTQDSGAAVCVETGDAQPSFLQAHESFSRENFQQYYQLSPTQAKAWITNWLSSGLIRKEGSARSTIYYRNGKGSGISLIEI